MPKFLVTNLRFVVQKKSVNGRLRKEIISPTKLRLTMYKKDHFCLFLMIFSL